jgi:hypothetical protein
MKAAVIFSIPCTIETGFAWHWRATDHSQESAGSFRYYAECVADAKRKGFTVEFRRGEKVLVRSS